MAKVNPIKRFFSELQEVELSELDFENIGRWPMALRVIVILLLFALCVFLGYKFWISKQIAKFEEEQKKIETLKKDFATASSKAANLESYRKQMEALEHEFSVLVSQLPNDTEVPGLLDDITDEGIGNGLDFSSIGLQAEKVEEVYIELPIKINVRGGYHNIASFISGIASLPRIVTLHDFNIAPENGNTSVLHMDLTAKTYRYNEASTSATVAKGGKANAKNQAKK